MEWKKEGRIIRFPLERRTKASRPEIPLVMRDEAAEYIDDYTERHHILPPETVRRALSLLALYDGLEPGETLVVLHTENQQIHYVEVPFGTAYSLG